ncbi:hypothetical protein FH581_021890 [Leptospira weilii]|uniref:DUF7448 domain-containing protein n=1 Tax=Leptospira weilii TaxID=28184 RepID=UPI001EF1CA58|nr:hypothetical protein [Leptospira weilii]ULH28705.1 hypothetical protein FH586_20870 [Leptospira weilii]ULH28772.1 hypothetical protein FH586_02130 [Leptospira weilii]ULH30041.1 hypothetical protein FH586_09405 [Leptospira weilii]UPY76788.1 hypothetical protein FH581_012585 [Leptospira weilii]UPY79595.1 hypothetical protein FH581_015415 [Leptospira weilii]
MKIPPPLEAEFSELLRRTLIQIKVIRNENNGDRIDFHCSDGAVYTMFHYTESEEQVTIDDISGDLDVLIGSPITFVSISSSIEQGPKKTNDESFTWTFYKLATINGFVDFRWYGESNGYYSESVDFQQNMFLTAKFQIKEEKKT